jgi:hypothetical protein
LEEKPYNCLVTATMKILNKEATFILELDSALGYSFVIS